MSARLQEDHQQRLKRLLESGQLTPSTSPTPEQQQAAAAAGASSVDTAATTSSSRRGRGRKRRGVSERYLSTIAEKSPHYLPESINYIVAVSSRNPDVELENDHNLHCICSFPTHQAAHDWQV